MSCQFNYVWFYLCKKTIMVRYKVTLTQDGHKELEDVLKKGKHTLLVFRNACILLNTDEGEHGNKNSNEAYSSCEYKDY